MDKDQDDIQKLIQEFNSVDLISSNVAYREWLERKRYTPHPTDSNIHSGRTSPCHSIIDKKQFKEIKALNPQDLKEWIKRAQKNQKAYEEWTRKKEELEFKEWEKTQKKMIRQAELDKRKQDKEVEKKRLQEKRIQEWIQEKQMNQKLQHEKEMIQDQEKRLEEENRKKRNQDAFKSWLKQSKQSKKRQEASYYPHPKPWITESNNDVKECSTKTSDSILSPPHLYNERQFYSTVVPLFVKKYGIFVANGT